VELKQEARKCGLPFLPLQRKVHRPEEESPPVKNRLQSISHIRPNQENLAYLVHLAYLVLWYFGIDRNELLSSLASYLARCLIALVETGWVSKLQLKRRSTSFSSSSASAFLCVLNELCVKHHCSAITFQASSDQLSEEGGFTSAVSSWKGSRGQARLPDRVWLSCSKHRGYPSCVTRVTQKTQKFVGQEQKRGLNALFSMGSLSREPCGTALGWCGTAGQLDFRCRIWDCGF
jgi:hypothetical protein